MNGDVLLRRLAEYGDGADECLCREVERHLADCPPCGELRRDLERVSSLCRKVPGERLPDEVRARIASLLAQRG